MRKKVNVRGCCVVIGFLLVSLSIAPYASAWSLKEASRSYRGITVHFVGENTPPNRALSELVEDEFTAITGIKVEMELLHLEHVFDKIGIDFGAQAGLYDVLYVDQAWMRRFAPGLVNLDSFMKNNPSLVDPEFDLADIFPSLLESQGIVEGEFLGIPWDIPICFLVYRTDIFEELGLAPPATWEEYRDIARKVTEAMAPKVYGTSLQMGRHYATVLEFLNFLHNNGGSYFDADGNPAVNSEAGIKALEMYNSLIEFAPPGVTGYTWTETAEAMERGIVAMSLPYQEQYPGFEDATRSKVVGKTDIVFHPVGNQFAIAAYGEKPGAHTSGGSSFSLTKYSVSKEAAFLFMQWATSKEIVKKAVTLIGGGTPVRISTCLDPEIAERRYIHSPTTTRHIFPSYTALMTENMVGYSPQAAFWTEASVVISKYLSGYNGGEYASAKIALDKLADELEKVVKRWRH